MPQGVAFGRLGNALKFVVSASQYVIATANAAFDFNVMSAFSVSALFRFTNPSGDSHLIGTRNNNVSYNGWSVDLVHLSTTTFAIQLVKGVTDANSLMAVRTTIPYTKSQPYHVEISCLDNTAAGVSIYVDGVLAPVSTIFNTLSSLATWPAMRNVNVGLTGDLLVGMSGYVADIKLYNRVITANEVAQLYQKENQAFVSGEVLSLDFNNYRGKTVKNKANNALYSLINYSDAETANTGYPQSGNTAWVNGYSLLPIFLPDNTVNNPIVYRYEYINNFGGATFPASDSPFYQVFSGNPGWNRLAYSPNRVPTGLITFEDGKHINIQAATLMNKPGVYALTMQANSDSSYWRQGTEDRLDHNVTQLHYT